MTIVVLAVGLASAASGAHALGASARGEQPASPPVPAETVSFGRFGTVSLYHETARPPQVVLFFSGDGGWNKGVVDMAHALAERGALVAGLDARSYLKAVRSSNESCAYPAGELQELSFFLQQKLGYPSPIQPIVAGYSSGATLAYAALAQAPPNTFAGAISLGFCPDLPVSKSFCRGSGLESEKSPGGKGLMLRPSAHLNAPWILLQGGEDQVCDPNAAGRFAARSGGAEMMMPDVGHGFSVPAHWTAQLQQAFTRIAERSLPAETSPAQPVRDLPLIELPAAKEDGDLFAVIVSGDGGWSSLDKEVGDALSKDGIPVVGLNSLKYFWTARTPDQAGKDLERIVRFYLTAWRRSRVALIGYSLGADVLPFMANRLPSDLQSRVRLIALLGPSHRVRFEFHMTEWLGGNLGPDALPVRPEVDKLQGMRVACFYGAEEKESLCPELAPQLAEPVRITGGHHFGGDYEIIAREILNRLTK
jgi:type IV secretory pathway VirJ component